MLRPLPQHAAALPQLSSLTTAPSPSRLEPPSPDSRMVSFTTLAAVAAALAAVSAAPAGGAAKMLATRSSGQITWFNPGLGACGQTNGDDDAIVAVSRSVFDSEHPCGRRIRVECSGRSTEVTVVDRCVSCADNDLDLSPAAFKELVGHLGEGRVGADWEWV